jgi:hypothetical protein
MNAAAVQTATSGGAEKATGEDRHTRLAIIVALALLGAQLVAMLVLSWVIYHRWSNTWDYAIRYQGWWGIAHGNLNPYSTVVGRHFLQDHFELINWPLAPLSWIWPHGLWPLWIQDAMVTAAEVGAVFMVHDALRLGTWSRRIPGWAAIGAVSVMLVANPWIYDSIAFDFHYQSVGAACFALLTCREMMLGRTRRLVVFAALCLACGDIATTYLVAVGVGGILAGHGQRRRGFALVGAGAVWFGVVSLVGGNAGSGLSGHYAYLAGPGLLRASPTRILKGALTHPSRVLGRLWSQRLDLWAYTSSAGLIGLFTPWAVLPVLVLLETGLTGGEGLAGSPYESFGAFLFLIPLSVLALGRLDRWLEARIGGRVGRAREALGSVAPTLGVVIVVVAVLWGAVWIPRVPGQWIRVDQSVASVLDRVERMIPAGAEVVASQGVVGRFADRQWLYKFAGGADYPLHTENSYFVIVPNQGIEIASVQASEGIVSQLAGALHARVLLHVDGVWMLRLHRTRLLRQAAIPTSFSVLPAWVGQSATGVAVRTGPESDWYMAQARSRPGYVLYGLEWEERPGTYQVTVTVASTAQVNLEVWDPQTNRLLSRQELVAPTTGFETIQTNFTIAASNQSRPYEGVFPFQFKPQVGRPPSRVEVRVWTPGTAQVSVYNVELQQTSPAAG